MIAPDSKLKRNSITQWWVSVDRVSVILIFLIAAFGLIVITTASPAVAERIGVDPFYFMKRHIIYLTLGMSVMISISLFSPTTVKRLAVLGFIASLIVLAFVPSFGYEIKGARRWLNIGGFSFQPSEFAKIFFAVTTAWLLSLKHEHEDFPSFKVSLLLYVMFAGLLVVQPDFGMMILVSAVWVAQLFIAGIPLIWFFAFGVAGLCAVTGSYFLLPHVKRRIDSFLNPDGYENYQIKKALEAFKHGGFSGVGPGEGVVKQNIPDSHADFIFAVIGEEMGFIMCLVLIIMFTVLVIRGLYVAALSTNNFGILAVAGILLQIGAQSVFNMGMSVHLFPTKGVTLPLVSYGGSSMLATSIGLGMMLALTRKRFDVIDLPTRHYKINTH